MAGLYRITSNYDGKDGWDENYIYGDFPREFTNDRHALEIHKKLIARAKSMQWGDEPIIYSLQEE